MGTEPYVWTLQHVSEPMVITVRRRTLHRFENIFFYRLTEPFFLICHLEGVHGFAIVPQLELLEAPADLRGLHREPTPRLGMLAFAYGGKTTN